MKLIKNIFKNNKHLMNEPEVQELIDYCQELEGQVISRNIDDVYDKELIYLEMIRDIYNSCNDIGEQEMLNERYPNEFPQVDYKEMVVNLKIYIEKMARENKLLI